MTKRTLTRQELADALGCHAQSISQWVGDGLPVAERGRGGRSSRYDEAACRAWVEARNETAAGEQVDLVKERARRERAQALLAEQLHATRAKKLLDADEVEATWTAEVSRVRAKILSTYTTSADRVHRASTLRGVAGVEQELKDLAYSILRELASGQPADAGTAS